MPHIHRGINIYQVLKTLRGRAEYENLFAHFRFRKLLSSFLHSPFPIFFYPIFLCTLRILTRFHTHHMGIKGKNSQEYFKRENHKVQKNTFPKTQWHILRPQFRTVGSLQHSEAKGYIVFSHETGRPRGCLRVIIFLSQE
ncbi:hypothetical protein CEXT_566591 [Caerostris extrusa]|uniref:Uncharacterized protein n=1 Tax=Caerostris extrusa TaxID=172846 RepID=A0AAV4Q314_CAEEX|nr:hypothetical protein CEXT_566591 [Caerostris extrusa]